MRSEKVIKREQLLADLNPDQRDAVTHLGSPLMVLAGAGSGKTRVITYRIAMLLATGEAKPWQILAVTFTNKAAQEMRERVWALLGRTETDLWVSTFHAACARILRGHAHHLGYERNFSIYDDRDQLSVVEACTRELDFDPSRFPPRMFLSRIRAAKQSYLSPDDMKPDGSDDYLESRVIRVYQRYQDQLKRAQAMDFDDLLFLTLRLFETHPEVIEYYRKRWRHVLVDEFQDTNQIQYRLVREICDLHRNVCVVGDDDQSIYSWRGADLGNLLGFEDDFPDTRVIRLEQNYRSTQMILDASGGVIEQNRRRKGKRLWTENEHGEPLSVYRAVNERDEAVFVSEEIRNLTTREDVPFGEIAVFYRTHAQSRVLEEELIKRQIPYAVFGGLGFYERKEIKDVLAYMRALMHEGDDASWRRIINVPRRGIGRQTLLNVESIAGRDGIHFSLALRRYAESKQHRSAPVGKIRGFLGMMEALASELPRMSLEEAVKTIIEETGYLRALEEDGDPRASDRMENLQELFNLVVEYENEHKEEDEGIVGFLQRIALISDFDRVDERQDRVSLLTFHGAKGLEFATVFMVGLEEKVFPHSLSIDDPAQLEEERRICYVGMTRARKRLFLTYADRRRIWGVSQNLLPSRFLAEIPQSCLLACSPGVADFKELDNGLTGPGIYAGRWVRHQAFGVGTVQRVEEDGSRVVIHFPGVGEKRFLTEVAPLEWL